MRVIDTQGRLFGKVSLIDLAVASFLLSLIPLATYVQGSLTGRFTLSIERVEPTTVTAGADQRLTVMGNGFDAESTIRLAELSPQLAYFMNDARLDLLSIPAELGPGWQSLGVTNGRGRFVRRPNAVFVVWQPQISEVNPSTIPAGAPTTLTITGRFFDRYCTAALGPMKLERLVVSSPTRLQAVVLPGQHLHGKMDLRITNPGDAHAVLPRAVEIVPVTAPIEPVPPKTGPAVPAQFLVVIAFPALDSEQVRQLEHHSTEIEPREKRLRAKIVEVLSLTPQTPGGKGWFSRRPPRQQIMTARMLLTGEVDQSSHPPTYTYQGTPLAAIGTRLSFHIGDMNLTGVTLSEPHLQASP